MRTYINVFDLGDLKTALSAAFCVLRRVRKLLLKKISKQVLCLPSDSYL